MSANAPWQGRNAQFDLPQAAALWKGRQQSAEPLIHRIGRERVLHPVDTASVVVARGERYELKSKSGHEREP